MRSPHQCIGDAETGDGPRWRVLSILEDADKSVAGGTQESVDDVDHLLGIDMRSQRPQRRHRQDGGTFGDLPTSAMTSR